MDFRFIECVLRFSIQIYCVFSMFSYNSKFDSLHLSVFIIHKQLSLNECIPVYSPTGCKHIGRSYNHYFTTPSQEDYYCSKDKSVYLLYILPSPSGYRPNFREAFVKTRVWEFCYSSSYKIELKASRNFSVICCFKMVKTLNFWEKFFCMKCGIRVDKTIWNGIRFH